MKEDLLYSNHKAKYKKKSFKIINVHDELDYRDLDTKTNIEQIKKLKKYDNYPVYDYAYFKIPIDILEWLKDKEINTFDIGIYILILYHGHMINNNINQSDVSALTLLNDICAHNDVNRHTTTSLLQRIHTSIQTLVNKNILYMQYDIEYKHLLHAYTVRAVIPNKYKPMEYNIVDKILAYSSIDKNKINTRINRLVMYFVIIANIFDQDGTKDNHIFTQTYNVLAAQTHINIRTVKSIVYWLCDKYILAYYTVRQTTSGTNIDSRDRRYMSRINRHSSLSHYLLRKKQTTHIKIIE